MKKMRSPTCWLAVIGLVAITAVASGDAAAQGLPTTLKGDAGLKSGSLPPPGLYITNLVFHYRFDELRTNDGREIKGTGAINQTFYGFAATYVSEKKILGAHYSASALMLTLMNLRIDTPRLDLSSRWNASDLYFQPIALGWEFKQADITAGYGVFVPTGRFTPGASDNTGLGQWGHEPTFGFTIYPSEKKTSHLATLISYDIQQTKPGGQKVGQVLTLEGGAGATFKKGLLNMGAVYYAQWKMTEDKVPAPIPGFRGKHRYFGLGPEINYTWVLQKKYPLALLFRYYWETGNRVGTQGRAAVVGVTFVIPHVLL